MLVPSMESRSPALTVSTRVGTTQGAEPMGSNAWEVARVLQGRPAPGVELGEAYNPLEAGLYHAVSLTKGCSIGMETLNKVRVVTAPSRVRGPRRVDLRPAQMYCVAAQIY